MVNKKTFHVQKLSDASLDNVSGGLTCVQTATIINIGGYTAIGTGLGAISCTLASAVCSLKASKAMQQGNNDKGVYYNNIAKNLSIASASLGGAAIAAAAIGFVVSVKHGGDCTKCCIGKPPKSYKN